MAEGTRDANRETVRFSFLRCRLLRGLPAIRALQETTEKNAPSICKRLHFCNHRVLGESNTKIECMLTLRAVSELPHSLLFDLQNGSDLRGRERTESCNPWNGSSISSEGCRAHPQDQLTQRTHAKMCFFALSRAPPVVLLVVVSWTLGPRAPDNTPAHDNFPNMSPAIRVTSAPGANSSCRTALVTRTRGWESRWASSRCSWRVPKCPSGSLL